MTLKLSRLVKFMFSSVLVTACSGVNPASKLRKSVVLIIEKDKNEIEQPAGTAFFIDGPQNLCAVLTAAHVASGNDLRIKTDDRQSWAVANVQRIPGRDLALLIFDPQQSRCPYQALKLGNSQDIRELDEVFIVGYPTSNSATLDNLVMHVLPGRISAIDLPSNDNEGYSVAYTASTESGNSGGPVIDKRTQRVVAVHGLIDSERRRLDNLYQGRTSVGDTEMGSEMVNVTGLRWGIPISEFPKDFRISSVPQVMSARDYTAQGNQLYTQGKYSEALSSYEKAILNASDSFDAWYGKGEALSMLRRYEDALIAYDEALEYNARSAYAWNNRGRVQWTLNQFSEAFNSFTKATELMPNYYQAWYNRGYTALHNLDDYQNALDSFGKATQLESNYAAWHEKAYTLYKMKRYRTALEAIERAIQLKPDFAYSWLIKGIILAGQGQYKSSLVASERAIQLSPKYQRAWDNKCWTLNQLKRYRAALEACDRSIAINPNNIIPFQQRGLALENLNSYQSALIAYEQALVLDPNNKNNRWVKASVERIRIKTKR